MRADPPMSAGHSPAILLATENVAKQKRLAWLLEGLGFALVTPAHVARKPEVAEDGRSHRANAVKKAVAWSLASGGMAIASDGGLVIPALGSRWASLRTRRFVGEETSDTERARGLLALMASFQGDERRAYWQEVVAVSQAGRLVRSFQAQSGQGIIALSYAEEDIREGFWVGALWYFPSMGKPYARLTPEELERVGDHWTVLRRKVQRWAKAGLSL